MASKAKKKETPPEIPKPKHAGGKKPIQIDFAQVESLAASQLDEKDIFTIMGIAERTFYTHKRYDQQLQQAIAAGRAKFKAMIGTQIRTKAAMGESDMIRFAAERKCGWVKPENVLKLEGKINHEHSLYTGAPIGPILQDLLDALEGRARGGEEADGSGGGPV